MINKKTSSFMEFLMTYGWAILVVLIAIVALATFGVLDIFGRNLNLSNETNEENFTNSTELFLNLESLEQDLEINFESINYKPKHLFDLSCSDLRELIPNGLTVESMHFYNLIVNTMILKECKVESKKEYSGKCAEIEEKLDDAFKKLDKGQISQSSYEIVEEEYNRCIEV